MLMIIILANILNWSKKRLNESVREETCELLNRVEAQTFT